MFRITPKACGEITILQVQGKLLEPGVEEFRSAINDCLALGPITLDLSGLSFVDAAGLQTLAGMINDRIVISACSHFVSDLLQTVKQ